MIHTSTGYDIELTTSQTSLLINAFGSMVTHDVLATEVESEVGSGGSTCNNPGEPGCYQDESFDPDAKGRRSFGTSHRPSPDAVMLRPAHPGKRSTARTAGGSGDVWVLSSGTCLDIARALYHAQNGYLNNRGPVLDVIFGIISSGPITMKDGVPTLNVPDASNTMVALEVAVAEKAASELQLRVIAAQYTMNNCWSNEWSDTALPANGISAPPGYSYQCHDEWWEISYDGGDTWSPIEVSVCDYEMVE